MTAASWKYDPDWVSRHYDHYGEKEWDRLVRSAVDEVNLHIHTEVLKQHLRSGMEVLEVGAGAGRFTQIMAALNCRITVVDISERQLALNRQKASELEFASAVSGWHRLDMCHMAPIKTEHFDAVVCYGGPISYVFEKADEALIECTRVLKKGGIFFCSVMSLWGSAHRYLTEILAIDPERNKVITDTGDLTPETLPENKHHCRMYRSSQFRDLLEKNELRIVEMSSANFLSIHWESELVEIRKDTEKWNELLRMEREACKQPGCWDSGTHMIAVCRRTRNQGSNKPVQETPAKAADPDL